MNTDLKELLNTLLDCYQTDRAALLKALDILFINLEGLNTYEPTVWASVTRELGILHDSTEGV